MSLPPLHAFIDDINDKLIYISDYRPDNEGKSRLLINPGKEQQAEKLLEKARKYIQRPEIDINQKTPEGYTAAHYARSPLLLDIFLNDPRYTQPKYNTKEEKLKDLLYAIPTNTNEIKELANDAEVDLNKEDHHRTTLVDVALSMNLHPELLSILLNTRKVDINKINRFRMTPLMNAVKNNIDITELLHYPGIDINKPDEYGKTSLFWLADDINKFYTYKNTHQKPIAEKNFKLLVNHPDTDLNLTYNGKKLEDVLTDPTVLLKYERGMTPKKQELLNYVTNIRNKRMVSEVALFSGTDAQPVSNVAPVQSARLPQLPSTTVQRIGSFLDLQPRQRTAAEKARDKEILKQLHPPPPPTNKGGRKTRKHKPISARYSRSGKVRSW